MKRVWSKRSGKCLIQVDESIKVCGESPLSPVLLDSGSGAMRLGGSLVAGTPEEAYTS